MLTLGPLLLLTPPSNEEKWRIVIRCVTRCQWSYDSNIKSQLTFKDDTDKVFVAKRFFNVGKGPNQVSISDNMFYLERDLVRCEEGRWFLQSFYEKATFEGAEVQEEIEFTQVWLAEEIVDINATPSPASGVNKDDFKNADSTDRVVWLIEPLRQSAVTRYSGTMEHPQPKGKLKLTLSLFVHHAFQESGGNTVFADLQGQCSSACVTLTDAN